MRTFLMSTKGLSEDEAIYTSTKKPGTIIVDTPPVSDRAVNARDQKQDCLRSRPRHRQPGVVHMERKPRIDESGANSTPGYAGQAGVDSRAKKGGKTERLRIILVGSHRSNRTIA